jgi:glutathione S-transferase
MMGIVKFYDLLSVHPKVWWSTNTYKTRFVLNYKRIPYTVVGIHYPDIEETSKSLGLGPSDRRPTWTLPIIEYEGSVVRGSFDIAKFLDSKFRERPIVGIECEKSQEYVRKTLVPAIWQMTGPMVPAILDQRDQEFFRRTRILPEREDNHVKVVEAIWPMIRGIKEGGYIYGNEIHYADLVLGSILIWMLRTKAEDFEKVVKAADIQDWWKDISQYM